MPVHKQALYAEGIRAIFDCVILFKMFVSNLVMNVINIVY